MLYEDNSGKIFLPDEIEELSPWEIEDKGIHVYDEELF